MAGGDPPPLDPFYTPIRADVPATDIETARKALEEARAKELREREKFHLEKKTATEISEYHQQKWQRKLATKVPIRTLNFDTPRQVQVADPLAPRSSHPFTAVDAATRPSAGATAVGAPQPLPNVNLPQGQPRIFLATREVDDNNLLVYTTLMDNIVASVVALANVDPAADNTLEIAYAKNLLNKCIQ
jgi:hypothetical protein